MNNEAQSPPPERREPRDRQVFLCDASAEAGRLLTALQTKGYSVVDVPLGMLLSRCRHELPEVIVCDADAHEADTKLAELSSLELPDVFLLLLGQPDGVLQRRPELTRIAHQHFVRPIDVDTVVDLIAQLCSPPRKRSYRPRVGRTGLMPRLVASARKPYRSDASNSFFDPSLLPYEREEPSDADWPTDPPPSRGPLLSDAPPVSERAHGSLPPARSSGPAPPSVQRPPLSAETMAVLDRGRRRLEAYPRQAARPVRLSVGAQNVACDLRPELFAALEEALDDAEYGFRSDDEHPESTSPGTRSHVDGSVRVELSGFDSAPPASLPTDETRHVVSRDSAPLEAEEETNPGGRATRPPPEDAAFADPQGGPIAIDDLSDLLSSPWGSPAPPLDGEEAELNSTQPPRNRTRAVTLDPSADVPDFSEIEAFSAPSVPSSLMAPGRAPAAPARPPFARTQVPQTGPLSSLLAKSIRERFSGAVAQQDAAGVRRILLTDGDIRTAVSTVTSESLAHYLHAHGDITRENLAALGAIPAFGRHAGAALIARGLLEQEDLWPTLRAHAEWTIARALESATPAIMEENVPPRLLEEPSVFGGAAGTEIYLEALSRVVTPERAFFALGGDERILGRGGEDRLLSESGLSSADQHAILDCLGKPLAPVGRREPRLMPLLLGLTQLGVLTAGGGEIQLVPIEVHARSRQLDEEAFVSKLLARRALVDEGDYFAVLGIARSATTFEVDRATAELLALYSQEKLTAQTAHLRPDLELVRAVITEAQLVLRDDVRRFRYKTALDAEAS